MPVNRLLASVDAVMLPPQPEETTAGRRNATATKARIIRAATDLFAERGYAGTGLRDIAAEAGVAVSLLPQHFGSKAELFEAALIDAMVDSMILDVPQPQWGRAMIDYMSGNGDIRLPAMVILSTGDGDAREITARIVRERVIPELAARLAAPDAHSRALQITMLATGFLIYARQLPVGPVDEPTRTRFAQQIQVVVDGG